MYPACLEQVEGTVVWWSLGAVPAAEDYEKLSGLNVGTV